MKKIITLTAAMTLLAGITFAQWNSNGTHIYNSNTGNVGIGTNTPGYLLHVSKNMVAPSIRIQNAGGTGGASFEMVDNFSGANWKFKATNAGGFKIRDHANGLDVIQVEPNSAANALYIKADGNVYVQNKFGLGLDPATETVSAKLQIKDNILGPTLILDNLYAAPDGQGIEIMKIHGPNIAGGSGVLFKFGKSSSYRNEADIRFDYAGSGSSDNALSFGFHSIQPFVFFTANGRVGIGTDTPTGLLTLGADNAVKPSTGTWTIASDERLKTINGSYSKGLNEILQLNPVTYQYKNTGDRKFDSEALATENVGFSAQDVQRIFPECVGVDDDGYLNFNMHAILVAQVNAIKEQQQEIEALLQRVQELENKLNN